MGGHQLLVSVIHGVQIQVDQGIADEQSSEAQPHHRNTVGYSTATAPTHGVLHLKWKTKVEEDNICLVDRA